MPVHDWTRVEAGIFHDFHTAWIVHLKESLNDGLLPPGFYAMAGQRALNIVADRPSPRPAEPGVPAHSESATQEPPTVVPHVSCKLIGKPSKQPARKHVAIRQASNHCLVAMVEIVSPGNKDRGENVDDFVRKARQALDQGCHLLVIDLFPPGRYDPLGMHGAIWKKLGRDKTPPPAALPLGLTAYVAKSPPEAYLEWVGVGPTLPAMPLFLDETHFIDVPLEATYEAAWHGVPHVWREVLEKPAALND